MTRRSALPSLQLPPDVTATWFVRSADNIERMTRAELESAYRAGRLEGATAAWTRGMDEWVPLEQLTAGAWVSASSRRQLDAPYDDAEDEPTRPGKEPKTGITAALRAPPPHARRTSPPPRPRRTTPSAREGTPPTTTMAAHALPHSSEPSRHPGTNSPSVRDSAPSLEELTQRPTATSLRPVDNSPPASAELECQELVIPIAMDRPPNVWRARAMIGVTLLCLVSYAVVARHVASPLTHDATHSERRSAAPHAPAPRTRTTPRSDDPATLLPDSPLERRNASRMPEPADSASQRIVPKASSTMSASEDSLGTSAPAGASTPSDAVTSRHTATRSKLARKKSVRDARVRKHAATKARRRAAHSKARGARPRATRARPVAAPGDGS